MNIQKNKTILLVEDEVITALAESETIRQFGYKVIMAHNGDEAVRGATGDASIDLVLMDIDLGKGIDGTESARRILEKKNIPVVFLTSHSEREMVERVRGITRYGYVIKNSGNFVLQSSIEMAFELFEAHEKMSESEARQRTLVHTIPDLVWLKDADGVYLACNNTFEQFFGAKEADIVGKTDYDFVDKKQADFFREHDRKAMAAGKPSVNEEWINFASDGHSALMETIKTPMLGKDSRLIGILGIGRDITARKRAEEEHMAHLRFLENLDRVNRAIQGANDLEQMMSDVLETMLSIFDCDRAWLVYPCDPETVSWHVEMERTRAEYPANIPMGVDFQADSDYVTLARILCEADGPMTFGPGSQYQLSPEVFRLHGFLSFISMALLPKVGRPWQFGMHQCSFPRVWTQDEKRLFQEIGRRMAPALTSLLILSELRESENRYRRITEGLTDYQYSVRVENGRAVKTTQSPACATVTGYTPEEFAADPYLWFRMVAPEDRGLVQERVQQILAGMDIPPLEHRILRKDGEVRWVCDTTILLKDASGQLLSYDGVIKDISEQKRAEEALRASERQMNAIVDGSPIPQFVIDRNHRIIHWNRALEEYSEINSEDVIGTNQQWRAFYDHERPCMADLIVDGSVDLMSQWYAGKYRHSQMIENAYEATDFFPAMKGGIWLYFTAAPIYDAAGSIIGAVETLTDITERVRIEKALEASHHQLKQHSLFLDALLSAMPIPVFYKDTEGRFLGCNSIYAEIMGVNKEYFMGKTVFDLWPRELAEEYHRRDMELFQNPGIQVYEFRIKNKSGEIRDVIFRKSVFRNEDGSAGGIVGGLFDITERKQAEESLRRSESNYRSVIENIQDVFYRSDARGNLIMASPSFLTLLGYESLDECLGRPIDETFYFYPEKRAEVLKQIQEKGNVTNYEVTLKRKDGNPVTVETNSNYYYDDAGNVAGVQGIFRNITDRKRAEEALRSSERQMNAIVDGSPIPQFVIGRDHRIIHWNRALAEYSGINSENVIGTNQQWQAFYDHERPCMADLLVEGSMDKIPQWYAGRYSPSRLIAEAFEATDFFPAMKDGTWLHFTVAPIYDPNGVIIGAVETLDDITEQKRAEEQLLAEKERLSVTLRSIGEGVIATGTDKLITMMNKVAEQLTGWTQNEAIGRTFADVFRMMDENTHVSIHADPLDEVFLKSETTEISQTPILIGRDGTERVIAHTAAPISDHMSRVIGAIIVFRDITEKQKMEKELLKSQKLESLSVFAGGIAHDFNNILTGVIGNISLALMKMKPDDEQYNRLSQVEKASLRAKDLTQQLLTFSVGGNPIKKATSIAALLQDSAHFALSGTNIKSEFAIPEDIWPVDADEGQINQVINNLIINACQAMPQGGVINIAALNTLINGQSAIPLSQGEYVKISIRDEGIGVPKENLQKIFDPFFTTKPKGTGLGLSSTFSIIKKHGGHITVDSKVGEGTTFHIYLPASENKTLMSQAVAVKEHTVETGRVLIMDDEEMIRNTGCNILKQLGYEADVAPDGEEAIAKYKEALASGRPYDLIIMDLTIPGRLGGKETIQKIIEIDPNVNAIASSGYSNDPVMHDFAHYGFSGIVVKPYRVIDMREAVWKALK